MKNLQVHFICVFTFFSYILSAQETKNSETRKFIDAAEFTQVNRDWNLKAEFKSGLDEYVSFFPVLAIDLKNNSKIPAIQMDMNINYLNSTYFKTAWIDFDEVKEFIQFLELYVVPNLNNNTKNKQSITYVFNSKEIQFNFYLGEYSKRISIYLKDKGYTDYEHYFWTETQVSKIPNLLNVLKQFK